MGIVASEVSGAAAHDQYREAGAGTVVCKRVGGREDPLPDFKSQLYQHHLQDRSPCLSVPQLLHPWIGDAQSTHLTVVECCRVHRIWHVANPH